MHYINKYNHIVNMTKTVSLQARQMKKKNTKYELNICAETKTQVFSPQDNHPHTLFMDFDIIQHSVCCVSLQLSNV